MSTLLITSLRVRGYQRFNLNPLLKEFTYSPNKPVQVILGTNSSGKSSLAEILLLYPIDHTELDDDGYVYIKLLFNNVPYELSVYKECVSPVYDFVVNGENLNETKLVSAQRQLVKQHFGITSEIRDLMMGRVEFTGMSAAVRRKWLIELSGVDYEYIMGLFSKVKAKVRDITAVTKHLTQRVASESECLSKTDIDKLLEERARLQSTLQAKLIAYDPNVTRASSAAQRSSIDDLAQKLNDDVDNTANLQSKLMRQAGKMKEVLLGKDPTQVAHTLKAEQVVSRKTLDDLNYKLERLYKTDPTVRLQSLPPREELERIKGEVEESIKATKHIVLKYNVGVDVLSAITSMNTVSESLQQIAMDHIASTDTYSDEIMMNMETNRDSVRSRLIKVENELHMMNDKVLRYTALADSKGIDCPSCSHHWILDYDSDKHMKAIEYCKLYEKDKETLQEELDKENKNLETYSYQLTNLRTLHTIASSHPKLSELWGAILKLLKTNPKGITKLCGDFYSDLKALKNQAQSEDILKNINNNLDLYKEISDSKENDIKEDITKIEADLHDLVATINYRDKEIKGVIKFQYLLEQLSLTIGGVETMGDSLEDQFADLAKSAQQKDVDIEINELKAKITSLDLEITALDYSRVNLVKIYAELDAHTEDLRVTKELMKSLSPTVGFIGSSLGGFLQTFIEDVNGYLENIWEYPLTVLKPMDDKGILDPRYRFPLVVDNGKPKQDIKFGSQAVLKIINLAFLMSVRDRLKLSYMPIIMDEVGAAMDDAHSLNMYKDINNSIISDSDSQCFVVSHDPQLRSVFDDASTEYLVLDSRNVDVTSLTDSYNLNIELF